MPRASKAIKTFSLDKDVLAAVKRTKGKGSESERVNTLLRRALELERRAALSEEAAAFFATAPGDRKERRAFQSAGIAAWSRE
jgi:Arc/MetJ family transcription regulator